MTFTRLVEHSDVDSYRVVHFARYPTFMETAVLSVLADKGLDVDDLTRRGLELRISEIRVRYRLSSRHRDVLRVSAKVTRIGVIRFQVAATIVREIEGEEQVVAEGEFHLLIVESQTERPFPLTEEMRRELGVGL